MGGSFGRIQSSAQWGKQIDNYAVYGALEGLHDDGFRNFSASDVRRFYGDVGYRNDGNEFHLNMGAADNHFGATATVPAELLQQSWGATYTSPQTTENRVGYVNLTGKVEATPSWTIDGSAHVRVYDQKVLDANSTGTQPCAPPDTAMLCYGDGSTHANDPSGNWLANPFSLNAVLGEIDRTTTHSTTTGVSLQATNIDKLFGHDNHFVVGASLDYSVTRFTASAELGTIGPDYVVSGSGVFLGPSGFPTSIGPVDLRTTNQYTGLYALDTFDVTKAFSLTAGGRFNIANIRLEDQIGTSLNGSDTYTRFNPIIGGTYKITSELTAYAGYSEANRAPTPLELGCADPAHPCIIAAFLVSDPPLKQVVSHTVEAGLRGTKELDIGTLGWKVGAFRARNTDDILAIPSQVQGFGYFQNVGSTRRQGVEAEVNLKSSTLQLYASYALVDARFLDSLQVGSNSPLADANGNVQIVPGNRIPAIPRNRIKAGIDYSVTDAFRIGGDALYVSSQYFVGDESNQTPRLPGYAVFNLHTSYQIDKTFQIYARADNIFDNRYATYGTFFDTTKVPNFANGGAQFTDPRSLSPARPRAFYAGLKATF
jgi:outer membrane receptor protein involved in Fe transport